MKFLIVLLLTIISVVLGSGEFCVDDSGCGLLEFCSVLSGTCQTDDEVISVVVGLSIFGGLMIILATLATLFYPLRNADGENSRCLSFVSVIFIPYVYFFLLAYQNPMRSTSGRPDYVTTMIIAFVAPVVLFCIIPTDGWRQVPTSAKVGDEWA